MDAKPLSYNELINAPEPECPFQTKEFEANGRRFPVTLKEIGSGQNASAEDFYAVVKFADPNAELAPIEVMLPRGKKLSIQDKDYIRGLHFLAALSIEPAFDAAGWAVFGHKFGGRVMNEILGFAGEMNASALVQLEEMSEEAGNESGAAE